LEIVLQRRRRSARTLIITENMRIYRVIDLGGG
jgi:hypothetical protein